MVFNTSKMLVPKNADMTKWSVVACDQYTSEPQYWEMVSDITEGFPSAYNLVLPEVYLEEDNVDKRIEKINRTMSEYLNGGIFSETPDCYIYVERTLANGSVRKGIMGCVDLEYYDYTPGSKSKIRATEKTVTERIPPRLKVRENASLELPHVMLLIDDYKRSVIEPLADKKSDFKKIYDFELMLSSGHLSGYIIDDKTAGEINKKISALDDLDYFNGKYGVNEQNTLLFAVGDGNHSLATAKEYYNNAKKIMGEEKAKNSPARYALTELVNLHDESLVFEAIHRVVFDVDEDKFVSGLTKLCKPGRTGQSFTLVTKNGSQDFSILNPVSNITVGSVQAYIDEYISKYGGRVDYIHGEDVVNRLVKEGSIGILLDAMDKNDLFKTVIVDGSLPRKTFSMGDACDKRFYTEARVIK